MGAEPIIAPICFSGGHCNSRMQPIITNYEKPITSIEYSSNHKIQPVPGFECVGGSLIVAPAGNNEVKIAWQISQYSATIPFSPLSFLQMLRNLSNFKLTQEIADYLKAKFRASLHGTVQGIPFPLHWTLDLLDECNGIVVVLVEALKHPSASPSPAYMMIS